MISRNCTTASLSDGAAIAMANKPSSSCNDSVAMAFAWLRISGVIVCTGRIEFK